MMRPSESLALLVVCFGLLSGCADKVYPGKVAQLRDPPNAPCDQSTQCQRYGWCAEQEGECRATADEHCRNSELCKKSGLCSMEDGRCMAKEGDCAQSDWCKDNDLCTAREGVCK